MGTADLVFPKDLAAFIAISEQLGLPFTLLKEVQRVNQLQLERFLKKIRDTLWVLKDKRIAVWGLTFKPDTDDVRSSVAIELVNQLLQEGAIVQAYDPKGLEKVTELNLCQGAILTNSAMEAADNAEALILATEWSEFQSIDFVEVRKRMHTPIVFDGRNLFDPRTMIELGFRYFGIGRANTH